MHIYAFGSICRGEATEDSDLDLLVILGKKDNRFSENTYSIYSYARISELWEEGNPFAWHLYLESKVIFACDDLNYLKKLGKPNNYNKYEYDYERFNKLLDDSMKCIHNRSNSFVFELSNIFLSIRNLAICYSLAYLKNPTFSRHSAKSIGDKSIILPDDIYRILERARILSTRGLGNMITLEESNTVESYFGHITNWAKTLR